MPEHQRIQKVFKLESKSVICKTRKWTSSKSWWCTM